MILHYVRYDAMHQQIDHFDYDAMHQQSGQKWSIDHILLKLFHGRSTINQSSFGQFATNSIITTMASNHEQRQLPRTNLAYN